MLKLMSLLFVLLITFTPISSFAATEFEDTIPLDVAEVLFDLANNGQFAVYSDIMDDFPKFQVPAGFSVVGSVYHSGRLRVGLETQIAADDAIEAISSSFADEGWQSMPSPFDRRPQTGFVSPSAAVIPRALQICHDELGRVSISYSEREAGKFIVVDDYSALGGNRGNCAQQAEQLTRSLAMMGASPGIRQYMPRMEVPESQRQRTGAAWILGGGSSSSNTEAETDTNLAIDWSLSQVYEHIADQVVEQGWQVDTETIGNVSANGVWTRSPTQGVNLIGSLTVLKSSDSNFQLKFRLVSSGSNANSDLRITIAPQ